MTFGELVVICRRKLSESLSLSDSQKQVKKKSALSRLRRGPCHVDSLSLRGNFMSTSSYTESHVSECTTCLECMISDSVVSGGDSEGVCSGGGCIDLFSYYHHDASTAIAPCHKPKGLSRQRNRTLPPGLQLRWAVNPARVQRAQVCAQSER